MNKSIHDDCLHILKALSCKTRLSILKMLANKPLSQHEIAAQLDVSPAIISRHIRELCDADLIYTEGGESGGGRQKICHLAQDEFNLKINSEMDEKVARHMIPIGLYSRHHAEPSCGLAAADRVIGSFDDPLAFIDPFRTQAELLWLNNGYVEYVVPLKGGKHMPHKITVNLEIGSEYPGSRSDWPSEISFALNRADVGNWICPGNYGDRRGRFTPRWWPPGFSQYGVLVTLSIDPSGTYIEDEKISDTTIDSLDLSGSQFYIRFSTKRSGKNSGGLTLFGKKFGDNNSDIAITTYYK